MTDIVCPACDHPAHDELGCTVDGCVCEHAAAAPLTGIEVRSASEPSRVCVTLPQFGGNGGLVEVNGLDMTDALRGITIDHQIDKITTVTLELGAIAVEGEVEGEVRLFMPPEVRAALVALGWTPPLNARPAESPAERSARSATPGNTRSDGSGDPGAAT